MTRHDRLSAILGMIVEEGSVHVNDIIERLDVSAATARRDLDLLADQQLVTRTRGGASANPTSSQLPLRYRTTRMAPEKSRIAAVAGADLAADRGAVAEQVLATDRDRGVVLVAAAVVVQRHLDP